MPQWSTVGIAMLYTTQTQNTVSVFNLIAMAAFPIRRAEYTNSCKTRSCTDLHPRLTCPINMTLSSFHNVQSMPRTSNTLPISNVTSITEVWSTNARLFAGTWRPLVSVITTLLLCCNYFSSSSVVSCTFSVLCMYSKFGHHPHRLGYLCAKFRFFRDLHCRASPQRNIAYSITQ